MAQQGGEVSELRKRIRYVRSPYGSLPWGAEVDGQPVSGLPQRIEHPDLGPTTIMGACRWRTKREAVAAIEARLLALEVAGE
jgi:hypothetical protein